MVDATDITQRPEWRLAPPSLTTQNDHRTTTSSEDDDDNDDDDAINEKRDTYVQSC